jgi:hypothetical protein
MSARIYSSLDSLESGAKRQPFRPQPMGLWLQHRPTRLMDANPNCLGLAAPARLYVCDLQACRFAPDLHARNIATAPCNRLRTGHS